MTSSSVPNTGYFPKAHILVVSNDQEVAQVLGLILERIGLIVTLVEMGPPALTKKDDVMPDIVLVDSHTIKGDDIEFCHEFRQGTVIPMLLFTSRNDEFHILQAYEAGVDEVLPQPISPRLFIAKIRSWLRRIQTVPSSVLDELQISGFLLNEEHRILQTPDNRSVKLSYLEARLLYLLMSHPNQTMETETLVERVWGHYGQGEGVLVKNIIYRLRRKIEPNPAHPRYLLTDGVRGYRFSSGKSQVGHLKSTGHVTV